MNDKDRLEYVKDAVRHGPTGALFIRGLGCGTVIRLRGKQATATKYRTTGIDGIFSYRKSAIYPRVRSGPVISFRLARRGVWVFVAEQFAAQIKSEDEKCTTVPQ